MSESEQKRSDEQTQVRITGDGHARDLRIYLDGCEVRSCLGFTLEADANGTDARKFPILTLRILCYRGVEIDLPANAQVIKEHLHRMPSEAPAYPPSRYVVSEADVSAWLAGLPTSPLIDGRTGYTGEDGG